MECLGDLGLSSWVWSWVGSWLIRTGLTALVILARLLAPLFRAKLHLPPSCMKFPS